MLRDEIAPPLRALGFKGSGQSFYLPSETHWALLGFQKSSYSDSFTINLTVVGKEEWRATAKAIWPVAPIGSKPPGANWSLPPMLEARFGGAYWATRIGSLMPGNRDRWWPIDPDGDTRDVANAVLAEIAEVAIPAMRERMHHFANPS